MLAACRHRNIGKSPDHLSKAGLIGAFVIPGFASLVEAVATFDVTQVSDSPLWLQVN